MADAEMAIGTFAFLGGEDNSMEVDLKALFSDPDGDSLTYSLSKLERSGLAALLGDPGDCDQRGG